MPTFVCEFTDRTAAKYRCIASDNKKYGDFVFVIEKQTTDALGNPAWCHVQCVASQDAGGFYSLLSAIELGNLSTTMSI